jgi:hypothetical protein
MPMPTSCAGQPDGGAFRAAAWRFLHEPYAGRDRGACRDPRGDLGAAEIGPLGRKPHSKPPSCNNESQAEHISRPEFSPPYFYDVSAYAPAFAAPRRRLGSTARRPRAQVPPRERDSTPAMGFVGRSPRSRRRDAETAHASPYQKVDTEAITGLLACRCWSTFFRMTLAHWNARTAPRAE